MDDEKPQVRRLTLKPKEIVQTETVARPGDGSAISVKLMHLENRNAEAQPRPEPIPFKARNPAEDAQPDVPFVVETDDTISVHDILQENRLAAAEPEIIAMPVHRRSRRNRDFMLIVGTAIAFTGILAFVFRENRELVGLGMFIIVFMTAVLAWIMYGVMDRY